MPYLYPALPYDHGHPTPHPALRRCLQGSEVDYYALLGVLQRRSWLSSGSQVL